MRSSTVYSALALLLLCCADLPDQKLGANVVSLSYDDDRPSNIALCRTEESLNHPAAREFWRVFAGADYAARSGSAELLARAVEERPSDAYLALLHGHMSLWRAAERQTLVDNLDALGAATLAEQEFTRAYALCPTDHRIPAWLGPVKVLLGNLTLDAARVDEGMRILEQGIHEYPTFVTFSRLLVYANTPIDDPNFTHALDAVRVTRELCSKSADPSCNNSPYVPHNFQGGAIYLGDIYARAQDRAAALATYELAKSRPDWDKWVYKDVLDERIRTVDARMAAAATDTTLDDHPGAFDAANQCMYCHQE